MDLLAQDFHGNPVRSWAVAAGIAGAILLVVALLTTVLRARLAGLAARTTTRADDIVLDVIGSTKLWLVAFVALWAGSLGLVLTAGEGALVRRLAVIGFALQLGVWGSAAIRGVAARMKARKEAAGDTSSLSVISMMALLARVGVWAVVLLAILDNLGIDITALVTGLGIGGIAIALAVQSILGDLFASVSIIFDKPFAVGEFIVVDGMAGTVAQVGLKTTRVRSISGEELILPNGELLKSRIRNFKRMTERRVVASIGVTYDTTPDQVEALPAALRAAVEADEKVRFDRAHFTGFGDSALLFELVYFVTDPDYQLFMDIQQRVNLRIMRALAERRVAFAFPTRTIYTKAA